MILGEQEIIERVESGDLYISPFVEEHVEPASVDLRLGHSFTTIEPTGRTIDTHDPDSFEARTFEVDTLELYPGETILGTTLEEVGIPSDLVGNVVGRSSLGRLDVVIHKTAGFIDPGFKGEITLEIENEGQHPVKLYPGDRVCQIWFARVNGVETPYGEERGSQYQGQSGATPSGMQFDSRE
ncbi:dCTP deaminase [Halogranum tailed virus 1]|uniref:Trimeric dUTPase n=1 Tax=Halogranum tailed virus 1 TaxID=1273749 RepID=R4T945_9CAUD|nr:dCTP deaminase [Halogranum tailed virus 1]AGM11405.1 trimeric dUTPase [Halogranum tailed virus 1]